MALPLPLDGITLQVGVSDMSRSREFYDALFGRPPAFLGADDFHEYEPHPGFWFQITTRLEPGLMRRLRFGVPDLATTRRKASRAIAESLTIPILIR